MGLAEIIRQKWVGPILADDYNRRHAEGRVGGRAKGRAESYAEGWIEGYAEGWVEGYAEGLSSADREWEAWVARRDAAEANREPFDEPTPSRRRQARPAAQRRASM